MSDFTFNISLGRVAEFYTRVKNNDPANSALVLVVLKTPVAADATLKDMLTLSAVLAASPEATNVGYTRKTYTDTTLAAATIDQVNDLWSLTFPATTWTNVAATGGAWGKLLVCYDGDTLSGADANVLPLTAHNLAVTPNGTNITVTPVASGFFRAT